MNWQQYIIVDENILAGKPVIKGTRISVEFILDLLSQGWSEKDIFDNYPQIKSEHLKSVFLFMLDCIKDDKFLELKKVV